MDDIIPTGLPDEGQEGRRLGMKRVQNPGFVHFETVGNSTEEVRSKVVNITGYRGSRVPIEFNERVEYIDNLLAEKKDEDILTYLGDSDVIKDLSEVNLYRLLDKSFESEKINNSDIIKWCHTNDFLFVFETASTSLMNYISKYGKNIDEVFDFLDNSIVLSNINDISLGAILKELIEGKSSDDEKMIVDKFKEILFKNGRI